MKILLVLAALAFAVGRFFVPGHVVTAAGSYEAFAHLFAGGLVGAWLASRERFYLLAAAALSAAFLSLGR